MNLDLVFVADHRTAAEAQALEWAAAEPNVESATVVDAFPSFPRVNPGRWTVTLRLVMRDAEALTLPWGAA